MNASSKVIEDLLKILRREGVINVKFLSKELGLPVNVVEKILEYLVKEGILIKENCSMNCQSCPLRAFCGATKKQLKIYRLNERVRN